jgi:two-component system copper resistance phosphate regulon response regulator CusR
MRILIVEDNPRMAGVIRQGLVENGYAVDIANTGEDGEHMAAAEPYDLVILDIMLPDQDGIQVCRNLRRRKITTPVLMLTALSTTGDKVKGLDAGSDDYLTKPFEFDELLARIRALLRRGEAQEASRLKFADLEIDLLTRAVIRADKHIKLTTKELALLEYFMRNPNRVLTRTSIGEHVWDMNFDSDSNVIDVYVSMLRRKVDKGFDKRLIHTIIGTGYCLREDNASS